jgi:hypothetical protein
MSPQIKNVVGGPGANTLTNTASRVVIDVLTDGAVTAGDVVAWTEQLTNDVPTVHAADTSNDDVALVAGVAVNTAASGSVVTIVRSGPAIVNIGSGTSVAKAERAIATTDAGVAGGTVTTGGATSVDGDYFGVFLGAEITGTDTAVVDVRCG